MTRGQMAGMVAEKIRQGEREEAVRQAADWLAASGRTREAKYLARDVARQLAKEGYLYARLTTARPASEQTLRAAKEFIAKHTGAKEIEIETAADPALVGGIRIETPDAELDSSLTHKLARFVEGAST